MSTAVVQVVVVALFALTCGALAAAWMRGRLGTAAIVLFVVALVAWVAAFAAIATEFHDANNFATCESDCSAIHYVSAVAFLAPPLLIALAALAMLELMGREHGLERREALALASVVVDLRVTQLVNGARGIHARLAHDAVRWTTI